MKATCAQARTRMAACLRCQFASGSLPPSGRAARRKAPSFSTHLQVKPPGHQKPSDLAPNRTLPSRYVPLGFGRIWALPHSKLGLVMTFDPTSHRARKGPGRFARGLPLCLSGYGVEGGGYWAPFSFAAASILACRSSRTFFGLSPFSMIRSIAAFSCSLTSDQ